MDNKVKELKPIELKPIEELKGLDLSDSDAFVCDMETGVCGPVNKEKETN
ncbi:hypothetical protein M3210_13580 [Oceanobacillus luteolus]|uniref:Lantibiotic n=1 Tax=Oceanobacillus luteolus TaxID=1274358 RepID=A0ABW4HXD8_9BACI|nr:hypothetical protein [Oceanobacillus luteolus]MCM3741301.1 hypothetical protein [Oceanobacillus luteolus]